MNYFETNLEEISRSIQLLAQIFEYQVFELQVEEKDENQTGYVQNMTKTMKERCGHNWKNEKVVMG